MFNQQQDKIIVYGRQYTNHILRERNGKDISSYYLPVRLRFKFKMFTDMDIQKLYGTIMGTLILSIYVRGLDQQLIDYIKKNIVLYFSLNSPYKLYDGIGKEVQLEEKKGQITFTYRGQFKARICSNVFFVPFSTMNFVFTVNVLKIIVPTNYKDMDNQDKGSHEKIFDIKFNCQNCSLTPTKISRTQISQFGDYEVVFNKMNAQYSNDLRSNTQKIQLQRYQQQQQSLQMRKDMDKVKQFQYAHFTIPVYRSIAPVISTIFFPLMLMALVNVFALWQQRKLQSRISTVSTIIVAFSALTPAIRQQIIPSSSSTLLQILVYIQVDSLIPKEIVDQSQAMNWLLFMVSLVLTFIAIISVTILALRNYIKRKGLNKSTPKFVKIDREKWYSVECDQQFEIIKNKLETVSK